MARNIGACVFSACSWLRRPRYSRAGTVRVMTKASARRRALSGSRSPPRGKTAPPANGFKASISTISRSRARRRCWKPSSREKRPDGTCSSSKRTGPAAVRADSQMGVTAANEDLRFVAGQADRNIFASLDHHPLRDGSAPVAARQDGRLQDRPRASARPGIPPWGFFRRHPCRCRPR